MHGARLRKRLKCKQFYVVISTFVVLSLLHIQYETTKLPSKPWSNSDSFRGRIERVLGLRSVNKSKNPRDWNGRGVKKYSLTLPLIDIIMVNDEMEMLEYRLNLHHSIVTKFVIVESNLTFKGLPKPSHVKSLISTGRLEQFNIEVLQVPFTQSERVSNDTWVRQTATRRFIGYWISQHYPNATVALSDVDELFDTYALQKALKNPALSKLPCFLLPMRFLYYGEACPMSQSRWNLAPIFNTGSTWFREIVLRGESLRLHTTENPFFSATCPILNLTMPLLGWHMSYAMGTEQIINKIQSFSANESFIYELINAHNVSKLIEERIQHCGDLFGREGYSKISCLQISTKVFDFKAPSLAGLPRHPLAPRMSIWDKCRQRNK